MQTSDISLDIPKDKDIGEDGVRDPVALDEEDGTNVLKYVSNDEEEEDDGRFELRSYWKHCKEPTSWNTRHTAYLTLAGAILPTLICAGSNFGVAWAIFGPWEKPHLWKFGEAPPMAGNFIAMCFVQTFANYVVSGNLNVVDVLNGIVSPLDASLEDNIFVRYWPSREHWSYWYLQPPELLLSPRDWPNKPFSLRLIDTIIRAGFWMCIWGITTWPIVTLVTFCIWGNDGYNAYWIPQVTACVYGALLSLLFMPLLAISAMVNIGHRITDEYVALARFGHPNAMLYAMTRSRLTLYLDTSGKSENGGGAGLTLAQQREIQEFSSAILEGDNDDDEEEEEEEVQTEANKV